MNLINDSSKFVVLQDSLHVSVRMDELQEQMAPIARLPRPLEGLNGVPGLMFPGAGIDYAEETGEISIDVPRIPVYQGIVGSDPGMKTVPNGQEVHDDYYIVATADFVLNNSWGEISGETVNINDRLTCGDENKGQDRWYVVPDFLGAASVLEVIANVNTPALSVDNTNPQRPVLQIDDVVPNLPDGTGGVSGLMPPEAYDSVNALDTTYIMRDFMSYPGLPTP